MGMNQTEVPQSHFTFPERLNQALERFRTDETDFRRLVTCIVGFTLSFWLLLVVFVYLAPIRYFLLITLFTCWYHTNRIILRKFDPPEELYLALFLIAGALDYPIINSLTGLSNTSLHFSVFKQLFHWMNLFLMVWSGSLFLQRENNRRFTVILIYWLILLLAHHSVFPGQPFNTLLLTVFLFLILLKRTRWLNDLSRPELIVYFVAALVLWFNLHQPTFLKVRAPLYLPSTYRMAVYSLPKFLYLIVHTYLLVLVVRIPLVFTYNFAPLSRKLRIASFFQATIPQFIQMVVLLFIFYLFISGWQANLLRQSVNEIVEHTGDPADRTLSVTYMTPEQLSRGKVVRTFTSGETGRFVLVQDTSGSRPITFLGFCPVTLTSCDSVRLVRIDPAFLFYLFQRNQFILGSGVAAFHYRPNPVMAFLYRLRFWQHEPFRINPVGIINPFVVRSENSRLIASVPGGFTGLGGLVTPASFRNFTVVVGRIFLPSTAPDEYLTLNVYFNLGELFRWNFMSQVLLVLVILFFLLNLLVIRRMARFGKQMNTLIVEKFQRLREGVRQVASGNLEYRVQIYGNDEFSEFARHFNRMSQELKKFMEEAREKERMNQELKIAHRVQLQMLPKKLPEIPGYAIAADMTTATEVGGDFYDVFPLSEHRFLIAIGDVSGKGMSAAFYMVQLLSLLRFSTRFTPDLLEIIYRLNAYLRHHLLEANIFVTGIFGILDARNNEFTFVRAGHNLPVVIAPPPSYDLQEVKTPGLALGITRDEELFRRQVTTHTIRLHPEETLVLYTDGFPEASRMVNGKEVIYGEERFFARMKQCATAPPAQLIQCLKDDLREFYGNAPRFDDQTILIIRRMGTDS